MSIRTPSMLRRNRTKGVSEPGGGAGRRQGRLPGARLSAIPNEEHGFTLIELLVSVLIMAVAVFSLIALQSAALQANSIAHQLSIGSALSQQVLEDIMALPIDDPTVTTTNSSTTSPYVYSGFPVSPATTPPSYTSFMVDPSGGRYSATYTTLVGNANNGVPSGVSKITVTVNYSYLAQKTGGKGVAKSVTITGFKRTI
jgi:prepilin-type N-terminal cleavage/methylation domain-containing protein